VKAFAHGLVVGKFCPLHRGHQYLLDRAQRECEHLVIISYTKPELPGYEPARRERWLADLYPGATRLVLDDTRLAAECRRRGLSVTEVPDNSGSDDVHRQFVAWLLMHLLGVAVDAVFTSEAYGDGFAAVLSREQQANGGPSVRHVMVDAERHAVPISGTALRADIHRLRSYLAPEVYKGFVQRVALLGGESTGKSVLAEQLASRLQTVHAAEYGRELWEARQGILVKDDMIHIARTQMAREESLIPRAIRYLFCDTTPLTTALYSHALFAEISEELRALAGNAYDQVFLCGIDVPFVQDGTRRDEAFRRWQHEWYVQELQANGVAFQLLTGTWEARLSTVLHTLTVDA
jgi:NadR type nicotinamide-nucleotide adenylyltransferase